MTLFNIFKPIILLLLPMSVFLSQNSAATSEPSEGKKKQAETEVRANADVQRKKADLSKKPYAKRIRKKHIPYDKDYFPNYIFTTEEGKKVKFFDDVIKDKVFAINFIFTNCQNICPLETARLIEVYNQLGDRVGKDIFMYSITVDPARDTPEVLKAYKKKFNIGKGWKFLTGKKEDIDELREKLGLYIADLDESLPDGQIDHNISLILGNQKTGQWMKRSPYESSQVLSTMLGDWLFNWKYTDNKVVSHDYKDAAAISTYSDGEYIFRTRCLTCHTIGGGDGIGPDLHGVTARREEKWLQRWISTPNEMIKEKDPIIMAMMEKFNNITMPNLKISKEDAYKIIEYIKSIEKVNYETAKN